MSDHVPSDQISSFVAGEVGEQVAIHIAEHLDECSECATRAAGMEPLAMVFASVDDPIAPHDLADAAMAVYLEPEPTPTAEIAVGAALLAAAAALVLVTGNPSGFLIDLGVLANLATGVGGALSVGIGSSASLTYGSLLIALFFSLATARLIETADVQLPQPQLTNW